MAYVTPLLERNEHQAATLLELDAHYETNQANIRQWLAEQGASEALQTQSLSLLELLRAAPQEESEHSDSTEGTVVGEASNGDGTEEGEEEEPEGEEDGEEEGEEEDDEEAAARRLEELRRQSAEEARLARERARLERERAERQAARREARETARIRREQEQLNRFRAAPEVLAHVEDGAELLLVRFAPAPGRQPLCLYVAIVGHFSALEMESMSSGATIPCAS